MPPYPFVSIIIPCRNEELCIGRCLDSIVANDYPAQRLEVIVIDGMSEDRTRDILREYALRYPFIRVLDNVKKEQPVALNIGIRGAQGDVIMRMDAHSMYKSNYISECIKALHDHQADNVGGCWITVPRDNTLVGRAICFATSVAFGVGNAYYRLKSLSAPDEAYLKEPRWGINVAYFCCRKELFGKIGLFNERLDRSEDIDFRARLKRGGYKTLFVPSIVCYYSMRTRYFEFLRHMVKNGIWVLLPFSYAPGISFSLRHVVPLFFLLSMIMLGVFSFSVPAASYILWGLLVLYMAANFYFSARIAIREKSLAYFVVLPWIFISLHVAYGIGSVLGAVFMLSLKAKTWFQAKAGTS